MNNGLFLNEQFFDVLGDLFPEVKKEHLHVLYYISIGLSYSSIMSLTVLSEGKVKHRVDCIMKNLEVNGLIALREVYHCRMISYFVNMQMVMNHNWQIVPRNTPQG